MTDANVSKVSCHHRDIVESFLQNVVVLEDLAVIPQPGEERPDVLTTSIVHPEYPESPSTSGDTASRGSRGVPLNADTVINAFADIGLACAVVNATSDSAFPERITKAAVRADIVVLDWKIHDTAGDVALSVMKSILADDQNNHRLRLIAIYTGEPILNDISKQVKATIQAFYKDDELEAVNPSRISKGPVRVVILAKKGTLNPHISSLGYREVPEGELADELVDEFVSMTSGLLRNVALAGIATIRKNAHRVLSRFDQDLDPAYLGQRLSLPHPPDAEDQLVAALGAELLSVLEEGRPGAHANIHAIERWLKGTNTLNLSKPFPFPEKANLVNSWLDLLRRGINGGAPLPEGGKSALKKRGTEVFTDNAAAAVRSKRNFAALLSLKTRYPGSPPRLTIGVILFTTNGDCRQYLLCLQPKCDSIRLEKTSGFPLIPLVTVQNGNKKEMSLRLVVATGNGQWEELGITPKPSQLVMRSFKPGSNPPGEVLAIEQAPGKFYFEDIDGNRYWWTAEMKDEHALKVAGTVASALARPGPNEAEWIR